MGLHFRNFQTSKESVVSGKPGLTNRTNTSRKLEVFKLKYSNLAAQLTIPAHGIQTYLFQDCGSLGLPWRLQRVFFQVLFCWPKNVAKKIQVDTLKVYILVYLYFTSLICKKNDLMSLGVCKTGWLLASCQLTNAMCKVLVLIWRNLVVNSRAPISFFNFSSICERNEFP